MMATHTLLKSLVNGLEALTDCILVPKSEKNDSAELSEYNRDAMIVS